MTVEDIPEFALALRAGARVGPFQVERVLGRPGTFGITYLARDLGLDALVALKEYLPRELAGRSYDGTSAAPHSGEDGAHFRYGLAQFIGEARLLARLNHPNVVRVRTFLEANSTAYLVMDYYEGQTLREYLKRRGGRIPHEVAVEIVVRLLDGLAAAHSKEILHRDVKPENIYLTSDGRPVLLDFGAAREAVGTRTQNLTTMLTPGFAPIEQYGKRGRQGPWTDVYAVGAVLYQCVTGEVPPDALDRVVDDPLVRPSRFVPEIPGRLDDFIMLALSNNAVDRPRSAAEFQDLLESLNPPVNRTPRGRASPPEPDAGPARTPPARGEDLRVVLQLTAEQASSGVPQPFTYRLRTQCDACDGQGVRLLDRPVTCRACSGSGRAAAAHNASGARCPACGGTGRLTAALCQECGGSGSLERERKIRVRIPPGAVTGQVVRLRGCGHAGSGGAEPGDMYVEFQIASPAPATPPPASASVQPVLRYSIGLRVVSGFSELIAAGKPLPAEYSDTFSTAEDNQTSIELQLVQRDPAGDRELLRVLVAQIPPAPKGIPKIVVAIRVSESRQMTCTATVAATGSRHTFGPVWVE